MCAEKAWQYFADGIHGRVKKYFLSVLLPP